jgi:hypothetical protein
MKKLSAWHLLLCVAAISLMHRCGKKDEVQQDCKTCTALNKQTEQIIKQQQVCTAAEETQFRNQFGTDVVVSCR